jgi:hypothetical protein
MTDEPKPEQGAGSPPPLAPGRGAPIVPGEPMSMGPGINARGINIGMLVWLVAAGILAIVLVILLLVLLVPR